MLVAIVVVVAILSMVGLAVYFSAPAERWRTGRVRPGVLVRAMLPRRIIRSRSGRADIGFAFFSLFLAGAAMGWALWSSSFFEGVGHAWLVRNLAMPAASALPTWACATIVTLALFLSYEFAYWLNHLLSHRVPLLWHFHKVHHTAESLSPLTNFRVHPVDTIVFYNMVAITTGFTAAGLDFALGRHVDPISTGGANLLVFVTSTVLTNLQHTHLWISFPGRWGKLLMSPAHHQIHHSIDNRHHDRNFGGTLALFDALAGTLHRPTARRERLRFGVDGLGYDPHGLAGTTVMPFVDAARQVAGSIRGREEEGEAGTLAAA